MYKKIIGLAVLAFLLFSAIAYAKPFTDAFSGGLSQINNFFAGEQYGIYAKALDFFFFSFLFIAVYMMGARYAFKEVKRPETVIVILLGLMTAFLMVLGGWSATALLPYIHWLLYALLFILYWWLLKGIKNKFWRFVLALLLTLLTIGLLQGLFDKFTAPDAEGFFKSFGKSFKGISIPGVSFPGIPDSFQNMFGFGQVPSAPGLTTLPPGPTPPAPKDEGPGFLDGLKNWWWVPLLILIPLAYWGWRRRKPKGEDKGKEEEPKETAKEDDIDSLINDITDMIKKKTDALKKIRDIVRKKEKGQETIEAFLDLYHKKIIDPIFYEDRDRKEYKELMDEHKEVTDLIKLELALEKDLLELMKTEDELIGRGKLPLGTWEREKFTGKPIELTSSKTQIEWYGKLDLWYLHFRKIQEHVLQEYNARLVQDRVLVGKERIVENVETDDEKNIHQRPELSSPQGIPDFFGEIFAKLDVTFNKLKPTQRFLTGTAIEGLLVTIKKQIVKYFVWTKKEQKRAAEMKLLTDHKQLEKWLEKGWATRWHDIKVREGAVLRKTFENEKKMFWGSSNEPGLFKNLLAQLELLQHLRALLQALKAGSEQRVSMTLLQELRLDKKIKRPGIEPNEVWTDITDSAKIGTVTISIGKGIGQIKIKSPHVQITMQGTYSVHTRIQEGREPLRIRCFVDKSLKGFRENLKKHDEARFTLEELGISKSGTYIVTFVCISLAGLNAEGKPISGQTVYERRDIRCMKITVMSRLPSPKYDPTFDPKIIKLEDPKIKDPRRPQDIPYQPTTVRPRKKVDLSPLFLPIKNQGSLGACVAFAVGSIFEYLHNLEARKVDLDIDTSELFLYYNCRGPGQKSIDTGTKRSIACDELVRRGICLENYWPYIVRNFDKQPPENAYDNAPEQKISNHYVLPPDDKDLWIRTLFDGLPIVFGIFVRGSFINSVGKNYYNASLAEPAGGGHAMVIVGYDSAFNSPEGKVEAFKIRNSWGNQWGENGYIWINADTLVQLVKERGDPPRLMVGRVRRSQYPKDVESILESIESLQFDLLDLRKIRDQSIDYNADIRKLLKEAIEKIRLGSNKELLRMLEQKIGQDDIDRIKEFIEIHKKEAFASLKEYINGRGRNVKYKKDKELFNKLIEEIEQRTGVKIHSEKFFEGVGIEEFVDKLLEEIKFEQNIQVNIPEDLEKLKQKIGEIKKRYAKLPEAAKNILADAVYQLEVLESYVNDFANNSREFLRRHTEQFRNISKESIIDLIKLHLEEKQLAFNWEHAHLLLAKEFEDFILAVVEETLDVLKYVTDHINRLIQDAVQEVNFVRMRGPQPIQERPKPAIDIPEKPNVDAFFNELLGALKNKRFIDVETIAKFGVDKNILNTGHLGSIILITELIKNGVDSGNFELAVETLSRPDFKEGLKPYERLADRILLIIEEFKLGPQPPVMEKPEKK